jgi:hypothetical protein
MQGSEISGVILSTHHGQGVTQGDGCKATPRIHLASLPFRKSKAASILAQNVNIFPSLGRKSFPSHLEKRFTQVDQVDRVKVRHRKILIPGVSADSYDCSHLLNIPPSPPTDINPDFGERISGDWLSLEVTRQKLEHSLSAFKKVSTS